MWSCGLAPGRGFLWRSSGEMIMRGYLLLLPTKCPAHLSAVWGARVWSSAVWMPCPKTQHGVPSEVWSMQNRARWKKQHSQEERWQDSSSLLFFLEGNAFDSPRQNKKVCMGTEDLMGYLVAWADSRVTERPESSGIRRLPHLILCLCSLIQSLGSTHVQICVRVRAYQW